MNQCYLLNVAASDERNVSRRFIRVVAACPNFGTERNFDKSKPLKRESTIREERRAKKNLGIFLVFTFLGERERERIRNGHVTAIQAGRGSGRRAKGSVSKVLLIPHRCVRGVIYLYPSISAGCTQPIGRYFQQGGSRSRFRSCVAYKYCAQIRAGRAYL